VFLGLIVSVENGIVIRTVHFVFHSSLRLVIPGAAWAMP